MSTKVTVQRRRQCWWWWQCGGTTRNSGRHAQSPSNVRLRLARRASPNGPQTSVAGTERLKFPRTPLAAYRGAPRIHQGNHEASAANDFVYRRHPTFDLAFLHGRLFLTTPTPNSESYYCLCGERIQRVRQVIAQCAQPHSSAASRFFSLLCLFFHQGRRRNTCRVY